MTDIHVINEGSIFLFEPRSSAGAAWIEDNVPADALWFGGSLAVEHRYASDLADGMVADGLEVI